MDKCLMSSHRGMDGKSMMDLKAKRLGWEGGGREGFMDQLLLLFEKPTCIILWLQRFTTLTEKVSNQQLGTLTTQRKTTKKFSFLKKQHRQLVVKSLNVKKIDKKVDVKNLCYIVINIKRKRESERAMNKIRTGWMGMEKRIE